MTTLYKATETRRTTLSQEARIVLPPEEDGDAPAHSYREVQVVVPEGNGAFVAVDVPVQRGFEEPGIGPNRTYNMPKLSPGQAIVFRLQPQQYILAMSESGNVFLTLIIEYILD